MKKTILFGFLATSVAFTACNNAAEKEVETTEAQETTAAEGVEYALASGAQVMWKGFKTNVDWSHWGTIAVKEGTFTVSNGELTGGSFTIDMNTMVAEDFKENKKYADLMGHLASPDFFDVANYPTAEFVITGVEAAANDEKGTTHKINGNLTMRGTTKNISFDAKVVVSDQGVSFSAPEFGIDRKNWNVMFSSTGAENFASLTKDQLIDDTILLWMDLTATPSTVAMNE